MSFTPEKPLFPNPVIPKTSVSKFNFLFIIARIFKFGYKKPSGNNYGQVGPNK